MESTNSFQTWLGRLTPYGWTWTIQWYFRESVIQASQGQMESSNQAVDRCACVWTPWNMHFLGGPGTQASLPRHDFRWWRQGLCFCTSVSSQLLACRMQSGVTESSDTNLCGWPCNVQRCWWIHSLLGSGLTSTNCHMQFLILTYFHVTLSLVARIVAL